MESHSFSVEIAGKYGINCALILNTFSFWHRKNIENEKNIYKERVWIRMSVAEMCGVYSYLTSDKIRGAVKKLQDEGLIEVDSFNKNKYDKTKWYSLTNKACEIMRIDQICTSENMERVNKGQKPLSIHLGKSQIHSGKSEIHVGKNPNPIEENPKPIPDTKEDTGKDNKELSIRDKIDWVIDEFNRIMNRTVRKSTKDYRDRIRKRLKEGYDAAAFRMVFQYKKEEWEDDDVSAKWLNIVTLCRHFPKYFDEADEHFNGPLRKREERIKQARNGEPDAVRKKRKVKNEGVNKLAEKLGK